jgi:hypothetical protein
MAGSSYLSHVNNAPNAVSCFHVGKSFVDSTQRLPMSDELINFETTIHIVLH